MQAKTLKVTSTLSIAEDKDLLKAIGHKGGRHASRELKRFARIGVAMTRLGAVVGQDLAGETLIFVPMKKALVDIRSAIDSVTLPFAEHFDPLNADDDSETRRNQLLQEIAEFEDFELKQNHAAEWD